MTIRLLFSKKKIVFIFLWLHSCQILCFYHNGKRAKTAITIYININFKKHNTNACDVPMEYAYKQIIFYVNITYHSYCKEIPM